MDNKEQSKNNVTLSFDFIKSQKKIIYHNDNLYFYNGKFYELCSKKALATKIFRFFEDRAIISSWTSQREREIIEAIKRNKNVKEVELDNSDEFMPFINGVYSFKEKKLYPHSPRFFFSYVIDVFYDETKQEAPAFQEFIYSIFSPEEYDAMFSIIIQLGGYLIYPENKINQLFLFLGSGANGKSLLIDIYKSFFPKEYVTSLSLSQLSNGDGFQRAPLLRSKLNIFAEEKGKKTNSEEIKKITAGNQITIQVKFGESVDITPRIKLIGDANDMLTFNDTTDGTYRRLYFVSFNNKFMPKEDYKIEEKKGDPSKRRIYIEKNYDELLASILEEKTAILNMFLEGLSLLKENNWRLPKTSNLNEIMNRFSEESDPLGTWLKDNYVEIKQDDDFNIKEDEDAYTSLNEIANEFRIFYREYANKENKNSTNTIGKKIVQTFRVQSCRGYRQDELGNKKQTTLYPITKKISPITKKEIYGK